MVELGRKFHALDLLDQPRDIFYLEVEEFWATSPAPADDRPARPGGAAQGRVRRVIASCRRRPTASRRAAPVHEGNTFQGKATARRRPPEGDRLKGLGCCPGVVRGRARVITDPRNATLNTGDILVAERTDPGWIMLFPSAAGLLVERGSLLSHSAIVAREMGIPSVVALSGVTRWLRDGDLVELDGSTGVVVRLAQAGKEAALDLRGANMKAQGKALGNRATKKYSGSTRHGIVGSSSIFRRFSAMISTTSSKSGSPLNIPANGNHG